MATDTADAGETLIQVPSTALAGVLYAVSRDKDRGVALAGTPEATREALVGTGPVSLAPVDDAELVEFAGLVTDRNTHDALVVASHRARGTEAILTTDGPIEDAGVDVLWERPPSAERPAEWFEA